LFIKINLFPRSVKILSKACFANSKIETLTFETESQLTRIEELYFRNCSLKSIAILGKSSFYAAKIEALIFEAGSRLTRIGETCFYDCSLKSLCDAYSIENLDKFCFIISKIGK